MHGKITFFEEAVLDVLKQTEQGSVRRTPTGTERQKKAGSESEGLSQQHL